MIENALFLKNQKKSGSDDGFQLCLPLLIRIFVAHFCGSSLDGISFSEDYYTRFAGYHCQLSRSFGVPFITSSSSDYNIVTLPEPIARSNSLFVDLLLIKILEKATVSIFLKRAYYYVWPCVHPYLFYHHIYRVGLRKS